MTIIIWNSCYNYVRTGNLQIYLSVAFREILMLSLGVLPKISHKTTTRDLHNSLCVERCSSYRKQTCTQGFHNRNVFVGMNFLNYIVIYSRIRHSNCTYLNRHIDTSTYSTFDLQYFCKLNKSKVFLKAYYLVMPNKRLKRTEENIFTLKIVSTSWCWSQKNLLQMSLNIGRFIFF